MKKILFLTALVSFLLPSSMVEAGNTVKITKKDCQKIAKRRPQPGAAYQGGVDVRGRKVKGADLDGGSPIKVPNVIQFDLNADMSKYMSDNAADKLGDANAKIGTVRYDIKSGGMTFNGKRLTSPDAAEIRARCAEILGARP